MENISSVYGQSFLFTQMESGEWLEEMWVHLVEKRVLAILKKLKVNQMLIQIKRTQ